MMIKTKYGFSLIEMVITVTLIGVLAAVGLPAYQDYTSETSIDQCMKLITSARMTADSIILENGGSALTIDDPEDIELTDAGDCDVDVANGNASGNIDILGVVRSNTMRWRRDGTDGTWICETTAGDDTLAPLTCP